MSRLCSFSFLVPSIYFPNIPLLLPPPMSIYLTKVYSPIRSQLSYPCPSTHSELRAFQVYSRYPPLSEYSLALIVFRMLYHNDQVVYQDSYLNCMLLEGQLYLLSYLSSETNLVPSKRSRYSIKNNDNHNSNNKS